ncbi:hypothetical protein LIPSTDRAFT_76620 [Lipomyces starkeyi NRRL Y-11557]|uniref:SWIM-type domain-containing protein n=1 Tax=Lipomyces starkeyi NRRL Y-11557 TaxID=675824 RepID=A0A1E3PTX8_LIPST|nr:hypothetical protein LIPSTDRAFT_76620 [Lipomyces starkeyi NRRL Y-11557]
MKKVRQQEKESSWETCDCSAWNRYLLPCSHRIQLGVPISITDVHPRWWVNPKFPPVNVFFQHIDAEVLLHLKDPAAALPRKGRPKGTRRLQTSAEVVQKMTDRVEKVRRCGSCKKTGHDRRNCPKPSNNLITTENEATAKDKEPSTMQQASVMDEVNSQMMNPLMGTITIIATKNSRRCGLTYRPFL